MINPSFIPGNHEHNFKVLEYLSEQENPPLVLLYVSEDNIRNGKTRNIYDCAISQALKELFGKHCTVPTTQQVKGSLCSQVSDPKSQRRYKIYLGRLNDPRGFNPEEYDDSGGNVRPGVVLVQGVKAGPRPVDQYPPKRAKRAMIPTIIGNDGDVVGVNDGDVVGDVLTRPKQNRSPRGHSRGWAGEHGVTIKGQDLYLRKKVMDVLSGDTDSSVDLFS